MFIGNLEIYGVIYKIENLVNGKIYIGQTSQDGGFDDRYSYKGEGIERTYTYHLKSKNLNKAYNSHLLKSIDKYGFDNFKVNKIFDIAFSKEELDIKEQCWISIYDSFNSGYNYNLGGNGNKGSEGLFGKDNPSSRQVVQLSVNGDYIRTWDCITDVTREFGFLRSCINSACSGDKKSAYGFMWMYIEDYNKNKENILKYSCNTGKYNQKPIVQLSLNGNFITSFKSITEASLIDEKFSVYEISACCRKVKKSHKGYMWIFKNEYDKGIIPTYKIVNDCKPKQIVQLTKSNEYINKFNSIVEASKKLNLRPSDITRNCKHKGKSVGGYVFMYKKEYEELNQAI